MEIDNDEHLVAWTQLLEETDLERATDAMASLLRLSHILYSDALKQIAQCGQLTNNPCFCYQPAQGGNPSINLQTDGAPLLVALAQEAMRARQHLKYLKKTECHDDNDLVRRFIRVLYRDPRTEELRCLPELTTDIACGESVVREGEITNGGKESNS